MFAALPAGQSAALAAALPATVKVVDLGPDFRLADPDAWARHYGGAHPGRWVTGLPELPGQRDRIAAASRVAAPGCYATAAILALVPVVAAGLAQPQDVVVVAASGTSGAGRSLRADLLASEVMGSVAAYNVGGTHRHTAEITQALSELGGAAATVSFTPVLAPMPRGILATCTARLAAPDVSTAALRDAIASAYAGSPFACLLPEGRWPATASVAGLERGAPAGRGRRARGPGRRRGRHRQPGQGRGRPGHPERQPDARPARGSRPDRERSSAMTVTAPGGFRAAGVAAGIKASGGADVAVVINDGPSRAAAGVFTSNRVKAAPVRVEPAGPAGRPAARGRAQLRRRQRVHRARRVRRHPPHRGAPGQGLDRPRAGSGRGRAGEVAPGRSPSARPG